MGGDMYRSAENASKEEQLAAAKQVVEHRASIVHLGALLTLHRRHPPCRGHTGSVAASRSGQGCLLVVRVVVLLE